MLLKRSIKSIMYGKSNAVKAIIIQNVFQGETASKAEPTMPQTSIARLNIRYSAFSFSLKRWNCLYAA